MEAPLLLPVSTSAAVSSSSIVIDDDITAAATGVPGLPAAPAPSSSSSPSTQSIVLRVVAVIAVACASLFAQHKASKGFGINVVSAASTRSSVADAGRRFDLFFVSNGRAERILHYASRGVERALFPDASFPRKHVRRVTVRMAGHNLTADGEDAAVDATAAPGEYVISLSPALVSRTGDHDAAVAAAVRRAVARMWLWDGRGAAPARVTETMVEYLASVASGDEAAAATPLSSSPVDDGEEERRCMSARFLRHLERQREGFVARLNRAMKDRWSDAAVDAALGAPARHACAAYRAARATSSTGRQDPAGATLAAST
ncbi:hypothetical protein HU200_019290 [Digitaria exilis]|uniref:Uncharacterized protein n=1 Tax=Digitaria exilis TaxID=1010633 RepID=A0A835F337_9POAL|nr:hypothetical protein HU200_019290 [Digitaria exilis]CAB3460625.1 unnamed protein product [Digitaria exilis]